MADKLARRRDQVLEDIEAMKAAGANEIAFPPSETEDSALVTLKSMRWVAATLLSRAFNLQIPLHDLYGAHPLRSLARAASAESVLTPASEPR